MPTIEYELRVLEVDTDLLIEKIEKLGGKLVGEYDFKRYVFDTIPKTKGRWIRLRTNGKTSTLGVKQIDKDTVDGTLEWEISVANFNKTILLLEKMGINPKGYQENKRIEYRLKKVVLALDIWPHIPPYLEIEGPNHESIKECAKLLGYKASDLTAENNQKIYLRYGIDIEKKPDLRFDKKIL